MLFFNFYIFSRLSSFYINFNFILVIFVLDSNHRIDIVFIMSHGRIRNNDKTICSLHTVPCCILLYPAVHCCTLLYPAVHCCILMYPAVHCCTLPYTTVHCCTLLYPVVHCGTLLYTTEHCCTLLYTAVYC